jgi:cysteine desulfurase
MIYCDYNAQARLRPVAQTAMQAALADGGNPSSIHAVGRAAKARLEQAREVIAARIGASAADIVFTGGATEAIQLTLEAARAGGCAGLVYSAIEHDALDAAAKTWPGGLVAPVTAEGVIDLAQLAALVEAAPAPCLVCLMHANNETGVVQPVAAAARIAHAAGGFLLVDCSQTLGRIPVDRQMLGADYLIASAHKLGGPAGAGLIALGPGAPFANVRPGGGQERGRRSGTENVAAIAGFAAAVVEAVDGMDAEAGRISGLRDRFEALVRAHAPEAIMFASGAPRLPNTSLVGVPGLPAEIGLIGLDLEGVCASAGAACSSGKVRGSRVLQAMGVDAALASQALRFSFGWASAADEPAQIVAALMKVRAQRLARRPHAAEVQ